jgi:hypothetical protein
MCERVRYRERFDSAFVVIVGIIVVGVMMLTRGLPSTSPPRRDQV